MLLYPQLLNYVSRISLLECLGFVTLMWLLTLMRGWMVCMQCPNKLPNMTPPISAAMCSLAHYSRGLPIRRTAYSFFSITKTNMNNLCEYSYPISHAVCIDPEFRRGGQPVHPPRPFFGFHVVAPLVTACGDA
ncbi:hypothetical protein EI94DRAFT_1200498 [Lactarius quietus]|nr:hypothetical protein EI94DRAFT_1200498 [Lactarius quietus]